MAVTGDEHQRGSGVERLDHAGEEVGGAGAQRRVAHPDPAGHLGVGVGREHAAALVVHEVVVDAEPARGVVERQELKPPHAEHRANLVRDQHPRQRFAPGHLRRLAHIRSLVGLSNAGPTREVEPPPDSMQCLVARIIAHGYPSVAGVESFGVEVLTPARFLTRIRR